MSLNVRRIPSESRFVGWKGAGISPRTEQIANDSGLPTGETEGNPFKAGAAGLEHEHVQFGTGTFDPVVELYYTVPTSPAFTLGAFGAGRFSFYENDKTYRGPAEITSGINFLYAVSGRLTLQSALTGYYQGFAEWDGVRDINSGLRSLNARLGVTLTSKRGTVLSVAVRHAPSQETLDAAGDTFEQGPTLLLHVSRPFSRQASPAGSPRGGARPRSRSR